MHTPGFDFAIVPDQNADGRAGDMEKRRRRTPFLFLRFKPLIVWMTAMGRAIVRKNLHPAR